MDAATAFGKQFAEHDRRIARLERGANQSQLTNASIDNGALWIKTPTGLARLGLQSDGANAVTYQSGTAPAAPTQPLVTEQEGFLIVGWDGNLTTGPPTSDVPQIHVHRSEAPDFEIDFTNPRDTYVGFIPTDAGAGSFLLPSDADTKYIRLVAVNNARVPSSPSSAVAATSLPISNLAIGKLTTETLDLVGKIRAIHDHGDGEQHIITFDGHGIYGYNTDGSVWLAFNVMDASAMVVGEFRTGESGSRVVLNPDGTDPDTIRFYPDSGSNSAQITGQTFGGQAGLLLYANSIRGDGATASIQLAPSQAGFFWGNAESGEYYSSIITNDVFAKVEAPYVDFCSDHRHPTDANGYRLAWFHRDSSGVIYPNTLIRMILYGADNTALIQNVAKDLGQLWGSGKLYIADDTGNSPRTLNAIIENVSSREVKEAITELAFDPLGAVRDAQVTEWSYKAPVEGELDISRFQRHIGPMAEDMPWPVAVEDERTGMSIELGSHVGLLHAAIQQLADRNEELEKRVAALEERLTHTPGV